MLRGVVEGFYGRPYLGGRRSLLLRYVSRLPEPAYMYAPKNDPFHRLRWRDDYPPEIWDGLSRDISLAGDLGVMFIFAISPWGFRSDEWKILRRKAAAALESGAGGLAVLFDDIPQETGPLLAGRQLELAERALAGLDVPVFLCPSVYCDELLERYDGGEYLAAWRERVPPGWTSMWTGRQVVSRTLDKASMDRASVLLGGTPAVWDNILADDYCLRRVYLSDLDGRIPEGRDYFMNPPECFPVALYGVMSVLQASGVHVPWPPELGSLPEAWKIFGSFHWTPWEAGGRASELMELVGRSWNSSDVSNAMDALEAVVGKLDGLLDETESIPFGWEMAPYLRDLRRMAGWLLEVLMLPVPARTSRLRYLMFERLPIDHPFASFAAELAEGFEEGTR